MKDFSCQRGWGLGLWEGKSQEFRCGGLIQGHCILTVCTLSPAIPEVGVGWQLLCWTAWCGEESDPVSHVQGEVQIGGYLRTTCVRGLRQPYHIPLCPAQSWSGHTRGAQKWCKDSAHLMALPMAQRVTEEALSPLMGDNPGESCLG